MFDPPKILHIDNGREFVSLVIVEPLTRSVISNQHSSIRAIAEENYMPFAKNKLKAYETSTMLITTSVIIN